MIDENYTDWAKTFTHKKKVDLPTSSEAWESMFHSLKILEENNKEVLRAIFESTAGVSNGEEDSAQSMENENNYENAFNFIDVGKYNRKVNSD
jgi:wyosine [tRNA(Phe)-imidazoG37] synthetase (radical SAM superfamily)